MEKQEEIWKPIVITKNGKTYDYSGLYEVSNKQGRIRSLNYRGLGRTEVLKPGKHRDGYLMVVLRQNNIPQQFLVHRIVAEVFIPNPENLPIVNHIDENPENNSVENLEWTTNKQNLNHATAQQRKGIGHFKKVRCIETKRVFESGKHASEETGIDRTSICGCCKGRLKTAGGYTWEYVEEEV